MSKFDRLRAVHLRFSPHRTACGIFRSELSGLQASSDRRATTCSNCKRSVFYRMSKRVARRTYQKGCW